MGGPLSLLLSIYLPDEYLHIRLIVLSCLLVGLSVSSSLDDEETPSFSFSRVILDLGPSSRPLSTIGVSPYR